MFLFVLPPEKVIVGERIQFIERRRLMAITVHVHNWNCVRRTYKSDEQKLRVSAVHEEIFLQSIYVRIESENNVSMSHGHELMCTPQTSVVCSWPPDAAASCAHRHHTHQRRVLMDTTRSSQSYTCQLRTSYKLLWSRRQPCTSGSRQNVWALSGNQLPGVYQVL